MFSLQSLRVTVRSLRRQFESFKRKYARAIASIILRPVADEITRLWAVAVAKKQPVPDAIDCVHIVADSGFRPLTTWNALHGYIDHCLRFRLLPDADEIIGKVLPSGEKVKLHAVLPNRFRASENGTLWG